MGALSKAAGCRKVAKPDDTAKPRNPADDRGDLLLFHHGCGSQGGHAGSRRAACPLGALRWADVAGFGHCHASSWAGGAHPLPSPYAIRAMRC